MIVYTGFYVNATYLWVGTQATVKESLLWTENNYRQGWGSIRLFR